MKKECFLGWVILVAYLLGTQEVSLAAKTRLAPISEENNKESLLKKKSSSSKKLESNIKKKKITGSSQEKLLTTTDRRIKVAKPGEYPWSVHGQLKLKFAPNSVYVGSGTLIKGRYVLTAAHNLYDRDTQTLVKQVSFCPGKNGKKEPWGSATATSILVHPSWISLKDEEKAKDFDIGLIKLSKSFGKEAGYSGRKVLTKKQLKKAKINVTGYPGEHNSVMYTMEGSVSTILRNQLSYKIDTTPGQSGSGVWVNNGNQPFCIAIHTNGSGTSNSATRLTQHKYNLVEKWIEASK